MLGRGRPTRGEEGGGKVGRRERVGQGCREEGEMRQKRLTRRFRHPPENTSRQEAGGGTSGSQREEERSEDHRFHELR
jgi:hypothetical protein